MKKQNKWVKIEALEGSVIFTPKEVKYFKNNGIDLLKMVKKSKKVIYKK
jgi:hypothetical protein